MVGEAALPGVVGGEVDVVEKCECKIEIRSFRDCQARAERYLSGIATYRPLGAPIARMTSGLCVIHSLSFPASNSLG